MHLWWFPNSVEFGLKGLSPNHSQGKAPSFLRLDQVQILGPPTTPHDIIHYALAEREWLFGFHDTLIVSPHVLTYTKNIPFRISPLNSRPPTSLIIQFIHLNHTCLSKHQFMHIIIPNSHFNIKVLIHPSQTGKQTLYYSDFRSS